MDVAAGNVVWWPSSRSMKLFKVKTRCGGVVRQISWAAAGGKLVECRGKVAAEEGGGDSESMRRFGLSRIMVKRPKVVF